MNVALPVLQGPAADGTTNGLTAVPGLQSKVEHRGERPGPWSRISRSPEAGSRPCHENSGTSPPRAQRDWTVPWCMEMAATGPTTVSPKVSPERCPAHGPPRATGTAVLCSFPYCVRNSMFQGRSTVTAKLSRTLGGFPSCTPCPTTFAAAPPTSDVPHESGTCVTIDETAQTQHYHPESTADQGARSRYTGYILQVQTNSVSSAIVTHRAVPLP